MEPQSDIPELQGAELVEQTLLDLNANRQNEVSAKLDRLPAGEVANLLEAMPPEQRAQLWDVLSIEREGEILPLIHDVARTNIIIGMEDGELATATESMDAADLAEVIEVLPRDKSDAILESLEAENRARLEMVLGFEEGSVGRLMRRDVLSVKPTVSIGVVLRWLRMHSKLPPFTDSLMVVDDSGLYLGKISMDSIVTGQPDSTVNDAMEPAGFEINASATEHEVVTLFERRELVSVAVVDDTGLLLGRITFDEAFNVAREEADSVLLKSAGLDEEADLFAAVVPSAKRRGVWLGINLVTVFVAAWVIGLFEAALSQLVALAVLMPIVSSMGGIAGSQTLTLTIRGMALDQIAASNVRWLLLKELGVGALNGLVWALVVAAVTYFWFGNLGISIIIAVAMMINLLTAAICGIAIPLILKRFGIDPALSGAVVLTTVTDILGFLSFLGLATLFLI